MGCTSDTKKTTSESNGTSQTTFANASPEEEALRKQFGELGTEQRQAIHDLLQMGGSGSSLFSLNPADQASLNQSYDAQRQRFALGLKDFADYSSGGRGLRMSDTPISQQSMERAGLGYADLASAQANQGLNMGLMGNQFRANNLLAGAQALPAGLLQAYAPLFNERMAGGLTTTTGYSNNMQTNTPSLMSSIGQGIGIGGQLGAMGAGFGVPGLSGFKPPCWIAGVLYGEGSHEQHMIRQWLLSQTTRGWKTLTGLYLRYGQQVARGLERHPWAQRLVRPLFNYMLRQAHGRRY